MVVTANAAVGRAWAHHAIAILAGFSAGAFFLFAVFDMTAPSNATLRNPTDVDVSLMVTAALAATMAATPVRERIAKFIPVDPDNPVHSYALVLAVILLGTQLAPLVFTNVLASVNSAAPLTIPDLAANEVPYLVLAYAGVGIWMRRSLTESSERLALVAPAWWHITLALGAAGVFFAVQLGAGWLSEALTPSLANQVNHASDHLFGALLTPQGVIAIAVLPGICEELLFRGALQPRLGLIATALLFTAVHIDYGLTLDLLAVFVLAIGLGIMRRYLNTTATITCHTTYNLLVGIGLTGTLQLGLYAVSAVLLAVSLVQLRRSLQSQPQDAEQEAVR